MAPDKDAEADVTDRTVISLAAARRARKARQKSQQPDAWVDLIIAAEHLPQHEFIARALRLPRRDLDLLLANLRGRIAGLEHAVEVLVEARKRWPDGGPDAG
jgi:hypothetical protein